MFSCVLILRGAWRGLDRIAKSLIASPLIIGFLATYNLLKGLRWFIGYFYAYSPIFCIEFGSKLSRLSIFFSPSTDHKFPSSLSVSCHNQSVSPSTDHKFASSFSVNCHDSHFHTCHISIVH